MKPLQPRGRQSLADKQRQNVATERLYASMAGVPVRPDLVIPEERAERVKRAIKRSESKLESEVQAESVEYLLAHPNVRGLKRINSGQAVEGARRIEYCHIYGKHEGEYMAALDLEFWLWMPGGVTWPCELEMKRENWKWSDNRHNQTEIMQWARIRYVRNNGGIAGFCTSVEDVKRLLESI